MHRLSFKNNDYRLSKICWVDKIVANSSFRLAKVEYWISWALNILPLWSCSGNDAVASSANVTEKPKFVAIRIVVDTQ